MDNLVTLLARARREVLDLKDCIDAVNAEIEKEYGKELGDLKKDLSVAQTKVTGLEESVRGTALEAYLETGDKHPHPAITIKVFTKLDYDEEQAITYCVEHLPKALKVDKRKFEAVAKAAELDFVQITDDPKATVATDLSEYE